LVGEADGVGDGAGGWVEVERAIVDNRVGCDDYLLAAYRFGGQAGAVYVEVGIGVGVELAQYQAVGSGAILVDFDRCATAAAGGVKAYQAGAKVR